MVKDRFMVKESILMVKRSPWSQFQERAYDRFDACLHPDDIHAGGPALYIYLNAPNVAAAVILSGIYRSPGDVGDNGTDWSGSFQFVINTYAVAGGVW
jgi:hypothetical protein